MKQKIQEILKKELSIAEDNLLRYSKAVEKKVWNWVKDEEMTTEEIKSSYEIGLESWKVRVSEIKNCIQWLEDLTDESKPSPGYINRFLKG